MVYIPANSYHLITIIDCRYRNSTHRHRTTLKTPGFRAILIKTMAQRGLGSLGPLTHPPNSPTPSNGCELSLALSDLELFDNLVAHTNDRLLQYQSLHQDDDTITLLQTALKYLPKTGRLSLMLNITSCKEDKDIKQLRDYFVDAILKPSKEVLFESATLLLSS